MSRYDINKKLKEGSLSRRDFIKLFGRGAKIGAGITLASALLPERAFAEFYKIIYINEFNETGKFLADYPEFVPYFPEITDLTNDLITGGRAEAIRPGNDFDDFDIISEGTDTQTRYTVGYNFPVGTNNAFSVGMWDGNPVGKYVQMVHYQSAGSCKVLSNLGDLTGLIPIGKTDQYKARILKDGNDRIIQISINNGAFQDLATYPGWNDSLAIPYLSPAYDNDPGEWKINIEDIVIETTQQFPINNTSLAITALLATIGLIKLREKIKK